MKQVKFHKLVTVSAVMVLLVLAAQTSAAESAKADITGDWQLTVDFNNVKMPAILSLSKDASGKLAGKWISFGVSDLNDVKYEENKLSFVQVNRFRDRQSTSNFTGTIKGDILSGTLSGERGTSTVEGLRIKPEPAAVGNWEIKTKSAEKESTAVLTIKADKDGKLAAQWQDGNNISPIPDVSFKQDKLTFSRKSAVEGLEKVSSYELTVKDNMLTGTAKLQQEESKVEGKLIGDALIGKWELTITSERGPRTQILQVNRDLSGLYGATPIDKINLQNNQVSFKFSMRMRDQTVENEFKATFEGGKLTGDLIGGVDGTARKVEGKKAAAVSAQSAPPVPTTLPIPKMPADTNKK